MKLPILVLLFLFSSVALGRPIELNVRDYGWLSSSQPLKDVLDFYLQDLENDINEDQPLINPKRLNYGAANSSVLAAKGLGTDYVNNPKHFQLGIGFGAAIDAEENKAIKDQISGAGLASSVTFGMRMDQFAGEKFLGLETKKLMAYINYGTFNHREVVPGDDVDIVGEIDSQNFGLHFRYDLVEQKGSELLGWGGFKLHFGYEYSVNEFDFTTELDEVLDIDTGGAGVLSGRLTGTPTYEVESIIHSFPLEISSSVLFLQFFSLYSGLGADFNIGSSKGKGDVKGDFTTLACSSGICVGESALPQLEAQANYDSESQVKDITYRAFLGAQMDLPLKLHAFGQVQQVLGTKLYGATAGLKFTF